MPQYSSLEWGCLSKRQVDKNEWDLNMSTRSSTEWNQWELVKIISCLTHTDMSERGPSNNRTTVSSLLWSWGRQGDSERHATERRKKMAKNVNNPRQKTSWVHNRGGKKHTHKKRNERAKSRWVKTRLTEDQDADKRWEIPGGIPARGSTWAPPLSVHTPSFLLYTHTLTDSQAPRLVCEVLLLCFSLTSPAPSAWPSHQHPLLTSVPFFPIQQT